MSTEPTPDSVRAAARAAEAQAMANRRTVSAEQAESIRSARAYVERLGLRLERIARRRMTTACALP